MPKMLLESQVKINQKFTFYLLAKYLICTYLFGVESNSDQMSVQ